MAKSNPLDKFTELPHGDPEDEDDSSSDGDSKRGWEAKYVTRSCCCFWIVSAIVGIILTVYFSIGSGDLATVQGSFAKSWVHKIVTLNEMVGNNSTSNNTKMFSYGMVGSLLGMQEWHQLMAFTFTVVGFFSVSIATCVTTLEVNESPDSLPPDFETKGTLSNCAQDITQPNGRMFTVGLFTYALLFLVSHYTIWLYRPWAPWVDPDSPFHAVQFESNLEKRWRCLWLVIPSVFLMFTAAFPSLSDAEGYKFWLMLTHNICAPLGMAVAIAMETFQLNFGENAFGFFFSTEPTPIYGPLTISQRARVVTCIMAWTHGIVFLSIQVYLGVGSVFGLPIKTNYAIALISYYGEVGGMTLVALMPCLAGLGCHLEHLALPEVLQMANFAMNPLNPVPPTEL